MVGEPKFDAAKGGGATVPIVYIRALPWSEW